MVVSLSCRLLATEDLPAVAELWEAETEWGPMAPQFQHWLEENPTPGSVAVVAVDERDRMAGYIAFIAMPVSVQGVAVLAARPFAPIVSRSVREASRVGNITHHPVTQMYQHAVSELRTRGHKLIFAMPDPRWAGFFRLLPGLRYSAIALWIKPLPLREPLRLGAAYRFAPLTVWDGQVDRLWEANSRLHHCVVVRDARILRWKTAGLTVTAIYRDDELIGLVSSRVRGERQEQWEICDVIAADHDASLDATLRAAVTQAQEASLTRDAVMPLTKIAVLAPTALQKHLGALGFAPDPYEFLFLVQRIDPSLARDDVAPHRWYLSQND